MRWSERPATAVAPRCRGQLPADDKPVPVLLPCRTVWLHTTGTAWGRGCSGYPASDHQAHHIANQRANRCGCQPVPSASSVPVAPRVRESSFVAVADLDRAIDAARTFTVAELNMLSGARFLGWFSFGDSSMPFPPPTAPEVAISGQPGFVRPGLRPQQCSVPPGSRAQCAGATKITGFSLNCRTVADPTLPVAAWPTSSPLITQLAGSRRATVAGKNHPPSIGALPHAASKIFYCQTFRDSADRPDDSVEPPRLMAPSDY